MAAKIGVFPASGALASSIVNHSMKFFPASRLVLVARSPEKLTEWNQLGATIRKADYDDHSTLNGVFDGVETLMLISYASFEIEHRVNVHRAAIDAAIRSGVKHIFYTSLGFAGNLTDDSVTHVMGAHLQTERYLSQLTDKITYTSVREGLYSESFPLYIGWFSLQNPADEITIPHSGTGPGVTWVKRDELGEGTAKLIYSFVTNPASFQYLNKNVLLTGPREISLLETVNIFGRLIGKSLKIREIAVEDYLLLPQVRGKYVYHGVDLSREWTTTWQGLRNGECAVVSPSLKEILGREPEEFETTIKALLG